MPDGDSTHRSGAALRTALVGRPLRRFDAPGLFGPLPTIGRLIERVETDGKHLEIVWDDGVVLNTHLRLNGAWHLYRTGERWRKPNDQMRVAVDVPGWVAVCFNAATIETYREFDPVRHPGFGRLAADLSTATDAELAECVRRMFAYADEACPIAEVLLDQHVARGNPENLSEIAVRGQYGPGMTNGVSLPGYRQEEGVNPESKTETFVALKLFVDNWRWADVPFYLRSGKRLPHKVTEIVIQFKRVPHLFFHLSPEDQMEPNLLVMRIQPDEGISLRFGAKLPGPEMHIRQVEMNFSYCDAFKTEPSTAYETLLLDALEGDPTLFNRADSVETAWNVIEPILDIWSATKPFQPFPNYSSGTWGPAAADALLTRDGRNWHNLISMPHLPQTTVQVEDTNEPISARRIVPLNS